MKVTIYTDPGCPFGFNAQRQDAQLLWHYGHALEIERRMIVLNERSSSYEERGMTMDVIARATARLADTYGMPMVPVTRDRAVATIDACRAYIGARLDDPGRADPLMRALRRRAFSQGEALDEPATLHGAARDAGIAEDVLDGWLADPAVERRLRADMAEVRDPVPEALALPNKLSKNGEGLRYSTASALFEHGGRRLAAPGFQPFAVHEVAVANLAPEIERRPAPATAADVLEWAPFALATAEVAELRGIAIPDARAELESTGAVFTPAANDGYWSTS